MTMISGYNNASLLTLTSSSRVPSTWILRGFIARVNPRKVQSIIQIENNHRKLLLYFRDQVACYSKQIYGLMKAQAEVHKQYQTAVSARDDKNV